MDVCLYMQTRTHRRHLALLPTHGQVAGVHDEPVAPLLACGVVWVGGGWMGLSKWDGSTERQQQ
jgi:hypothetical protein